MKEEGLEILNSMMENSRMMDEAEDALEYATDISTK